MKVVVGANNIQKWANRKLVWKVDFVLTTPYHYCSSFFYFNPLAQKKYKSGVIKNDRLTKYKSGPIACHQSWAGKLILLSLHPTIFVLL